MQQRNLWANLTARHTLSTAEHTWQEAPRGVLPVGEDPQLRINAGGGYARQRGPVVDVAVHFVSRFVAQCYDHADMTTALSATVGNTGLVVARVGYRFGAAPGLLTSWEIGATGQMPIPGPHREYVGVSSRHREMASYNKGVSDVFAEKQTRIFSLQMRGDF